MCGYLCRKTFDMAEQIINQIPGYENGLVHYVSTTDEVSAIFLAAQIVSDLLNKWNTNVAFFSYTGRCQTLIDLVKNESKVARLHTVIQKNKLLQVFISKAQGMTNRKSVRQFVLEGMPELDASAKRRLEQHAKANHTSITVIEVHW